MRNKLAMLITIIISIIIIVIMGGGLLYLEDFLSDSLLQRGKIIACFSVFVCRDTWASWAVCMREFIFIHILYEAADCVCGGKSRWETADETQCLINLRLISSGPAEKKKNRVDVRGHGAEIYVSGQEKIKRELNHKITFVLVQKCVDVYKMQAGDQFQMVKTMWCENWMKMTSKSFRKLLPFSPPFFLKPFRSAKHLTYPLHVIYLCRVCVEIQTETKPSAAKLLYQLK